MAALSASVFKLPLSGLTRGASLIFSKFLRLKRIDGALKGILNDPVVKTALSDYETYLAATHGQFSVEIEQFHSELLKSGLLDVMLEASLVGHETQAAFSAFERLYRQNVCSDSDVLPIYEKLSIAISASASALVKDPALGRIVSTFSKQILTRIDQLETAINAGFEVTHPKSDISATISVICKGLQNHYKSLKVETLNGGARDVNISDIYVPPSLRLLTDKKRMHSIRESIGLDETVIHRNRAHLQSDEGAIEHFTYNQVLSSFRRVVILGDPGGGKSTICQRLCFDMAKASALAGQYQGRNHIPDSSQKVPFRIVLRLFEQARQSNAQLDLITYLVRDLKHHANASESDIYEAVLYLLSTGRAVLAFDGLDEILDTSRRREYVDLVSGLCNMFPLCPSLITSRLVGYESAPMPADFDRLILQRFSDDEVQHYSVKFFQHIGGLEKAESTSESERFIFQTRENASDLRRNPLMLGLMLWIFMAKGDVPSNRPGIYSECATLMFDKWDANRGIRPQLTTSFDRAQLFSSIAARIYPDVTLRAGVTKDWLQDHLISYFSDKFVDRAKAFEAAESLVQFLVGRAWVMTEVGDGVFAFTHQTFLEYFYAKHVSSQHDTVTKLFRSIRPSIIRGENDVVSHLSLQSKVTGVDRLQMEAIDEIVKYIGSLTKDSSIAYAASFAAKSLEYLTPSEADVRRMVDLIYNVAVHISPRLRQPGLLSVAISSCNMMRDFSLSEVERHLFEDVTGADEARRSAVLKYIIHVGARVFRGRDGESEATLLAARRFKSFVLANPDNLFCAKAAFALYGILTEEAISKHGLNEFASVAMISGYDGIGAFESLVLGSATGFSQQFPTDLVDLSDIQKSLATLGNVGFKLASSQSMPLYEHYYMGAVPVSIWLDLFKGLPDDPEIWLGALFAYRFTMELTPQMSAYKEADEDLKRLNRKIKSDLKRYQGHPSVSPIVQEVILAGREMFTHSPRRPRRWSR